MRTITWLVMLVGWTVLALGVTRVEAIPGTPDAVPAATLLAPYFEADPNPSGAQDTLLVVNNVGVANRIVHMEVWTVNGVALPSLFANIPIGPRDSVSISMRGLIAGTASAGDASALLQAGRWRGFVTFDLVTSATPLRPIDAGYPYSSSNVLEGWIYFTRLTEGSSNGLAMVPIEDVAGTVSVDLRGFYENGDNREEIDSTARICMNDLSRGLGCTTDSDGVVDYIDSRVFLEPGLNGETRIIVFAWRPGMTGGPGGSHTIRFFNEAGGSAGTNTLGLGNVVNVITVSGSQNGWAEIETTIPRTYEVYAFVFNAAKPGSASLNWDAIFECRITP